MERNKLLSLSLAAALSAGLLSGCGDPVPSEPVETPVQTVNPVPVETPAPEMPGLLLEDQVALISANADIWRLEEEACAAGCWYAYAISDLDLNGRLELLSTVTQGTGMFTTSRVWEVSADGSSLVPLEHEACPMVLEVMGGPDGAALPYPAYYDRETDTMWLELHNLVRNGMTALYEDKRVVAIKDGALTGSYLAYMETQYDENGEASVSYEDADGNPISAEDYEQAGARAFPGIDVQGIRLSWLEKPDTASMSTEALTAALLASAEGFEFGLDFPD